ncbi:MAG: putative quinol monooxygenase [Acetanaerobacterium sp.]
MIKLVAKNHVKGDKLGEYTQIAKRLEQMTNTNDEGCISYVLYQDVSDPAVFAFIEEWENMEALNKHMAAAHFKELVPELDALTDRPGEMNLFRKA